MGDELSTSSILWLVRLKSVGEPSVSLDDIEYLIDTGTEEGIVEPLEKKLRSAVLRLWRTSAARHHAPASISDAMDADTPLDEVLGTAAMAGFSACRCTRATSTTRRVRPHQDLFRQQYLGWEIEVRKLLHPALFVPENMTLHCFSIASGEAEHCHALNEYGGTEGMVTLEDDRRRNRGRDARRVRPNDDQWIVQRDDESWLSTRR